MTVNLSQALDYTDEHGEWTVQFCDTHEAELRAALIERGMSEHVAMSDAFRRKNLEAGFPPDALTYLHAHIIIPAVNIFGMDGLTAVGGCPVCMFSNVVDYVADKTAIEYMRKN